MINLYGWFLVAMIMRMFVRWQLRKPTINIYSWVLRAHRFPLCFSSRAERNASRAIPSVDFSPYTTCKDCVDRNTTCVSKTRGNSNVKTSTLTEHLDQFLHDGSIEFASLNKSRPWNPESISTLSWMARPDGNTRLTMILPPLLLTAIGSARSIICVVRAFAI